MKHWVVEYRLYKSYCFYLYIVFVWLYMLIDLIWFDLIWFDLIGPHLRKQVQCCNNTKLHNWPPWSVLKPPWLFPNHMAVIHQNNIATWYSKLALWFLHEGFARLGVGWWIMSPRGDTHCQVTGRLDSSPILVWEVPKHIPKLTIKQHVAYTVQCALAVKMWSRQWDLNTFTYQATAISSSPCPACRTGFGKQSITKQ